MDSLISQIIFDAGDTEGIFQLTMLNDVSILEDILQGTEIDKFQQKNPLLSAQFAYFSIHDHLILGNDIQPCTLMPITFNISFFMIFRAQIAYFSYNNY